MERIVELGTLLAHYGALLTDRQRTILRQAAWEDCSLSEIAERERMTRQGVHDSIRCSVRQLRAYDEKLNLITRFERISAGIDDLERFICALPEGRERDELTVLSKGLRAALED